MGEAPDFSFDSISQVHYARAFARYERELRPFVEKNQQLAESNLKPYPSLSLGSG
jgi:hypothetical protein